ncbi:MAG TPA: response regulator [Burkholderiales bacterium]|nr:response regulator [Burkholderiales bacterium]
MAIRFDRSATAPGRAALHRAPLGGERVLAVDDDFDVRDMLAALLESAGAEVRTAGSGAEALVALRSWRPTVIVCDIGMPGQNGYELIEAIRALPGGERIPAAALTAYGRREDSARALAAGFQVHIPKPADADELIAALTHLARLGRSPR